MKLTGVADPLVHWNASRLAAGAFGLFALVALSAHAAHAKSASGRGQPEADRPAVIERLTARGTADSLAAAAVLKQFGAETDDGSYALVARAVRLAPDRADLAWLAVPVCKLAADSDP